MNNMIEKLKEKRKKLKEIENKRNNNDIEQFYDDSLKISNATDGMVILITENSVIKEKSPKGMSHLKTTQDIINNNNFEYLNLASIPGDFGNYIPMKYNTVFIRISSIINGPTIIYYPHICNEYQIEKLNEFNNIIKKFNINKNEYEKITVEYNGKSDDIKDNIDELLETLRYRLERKNSEESVKKY